MEIKDIKEYEDIKNDGVVFIDFFGTWCGPCKMLSPIIDQLAKDYEGKAHVLKVDVDKFPELASEYSVTSIPSIAILKNGSIEKRMMGYRSKEELSKEIDNLL